MRVISILPILVLALALAIPPHADAQQQGAARRPVLVPADSGTIQRVTLKDGSELLGRVLSVGETSVQFESSLGVSTIAIDSIVSVRSERGGQMRQGRYFFPNPNATRLIFAPSGRMLEQGEGYFSDYWIFFPGISVGLSPLFSIGGGMSIFPGIGLEEQLFYFTPKLGVVKSERFNAAVGALYVAVPDFGDSGGRESAGMLYGVGTWGDRDNSFTTGFGYGFANGELASSPAVMVGGEARVAPRASLVTENYFIPGGNLLLGGGVRFLGRGLSVDLALFTAAGQDGGGCCLPFLGFVYSWGR